MTVSILDLESRFDFDPVNELNKFTDLCDSRDFPGRVSSMSFVDLMNITIRDCPFTGTSNTIAEYYNDRKLSDLEDITYLLTHLNIHLNYIRWLLSSSFDFSDCIYKFERIAKWITNILEQVNYQVADADLRKDWGFKPALFIKRDADVDSVLSLVEPDIRIDLLTYLDFRVETNITHKRTILNRLAAFIEKDKECYKEHNSSLFNALSNILNNFKIRHDNDTQKVLSETDYIKYYDMCFKMILHLIRAVEIKKYIAEIKTIP